MKAAWHHKQLGEVCEIVNGGTPKTGVPEYWGGSRLWITPAEMGKRISPYVDTTERKITELGLRESSARMLPPNSVILSSRAPIGHLVINTGPMATNQGCKGLVPTNQLESKFLYYYLGSIVGLLNALGTGATFKELSGGKLKEVPVPVPSSSEQQRIVRILDESFDAIAVAKASAEKNLQNARALFESHLNSVFSERGNGWAENTLGRLTTKIGSGATPRGGEKAYKSEGISLIRSLNVHDWGFKYPRLASIDSDQAEGLSNVEVQNHDVLLNITGASVTRCCLVPEDVLPARVNQHVSIIRPIPATLDADFLHFLLISKPYKDRLLRTGADGGSTRQAITKAQIQAFSIKYPNTTREQKSIVAELNELLIETQHLESIFQGKLDALEALKKSLLHQAFNGQL